MERLGYLSPQERLKEATNIVFTPENRHSAYDEALDRVGRLSRELYREFRDDTLKAATIDSYKGYSNLSPHIKLAQPSPLLFGRYNSELEDRVFTHYKLTEVNTLIDTLIADQAANKQDIQYAKTLIEQIDEVVSPPDAIPVPPAKKTNAEKAEEINAIERFETLIILLSKLGVQFPNPEEDDIEEENRIRIQQGAVTANMYREQSYYTVYVPELKRIIHISNEPGNATYIFNSEELAKYGEIVGEGNIVPSNKLLTYFNGLSKEDKNRIIEETQGKIGLKVVYSAASWVGTVNNLLTNEEGFKHKQREKNPVSLKVMVNKSNFPMPIDDKDNRWYGFTIFQKDNKIHHFGSLTEINKLLQKDHGVNLHYESLQKLVKDLTPERIYILFERNGAITKRINELGYSYEEFMQLPELKKIIDMHCEVPKEAVSVIDVEDAWHGFVLYNNEHYAGARRIIQELKKNYGVELVTSSITKRRGKLRTITGPTLRGKLETLYSIESLLEFLGIENITISDEKKLTTIALLGEKVLQTVEGRYLVKLNALCRIISKIINVRDDSIKQYLIRGIISNYTRHELFGYYLDEIVSDTVFLVKYGDIRPQIQAAEAAAVAEYKKQLESSTSLPSTLPTNL